jgi:hypothetical protein
MCRRPSSPTRAGAGVLRLRPIAPLLLLALLLAACGGSPDQTAGDETTTAASSTQQTTATGSTSASTSASTTAAKKKKKKNVIAWILSLGPGAPDGPPEFTAYRELQQLHCATVFARVGELKEPARTLYKGAAHACLAATAGQTARWPRAVAALQAVSGRTDELNCMDGAALALLDRLVTLHAEHPSRSFELAAGTKSKAPPCPAIAAITPDSGPVDTPVRMTGRHLGAAVVGVSVIDSLGNSLPVVGLDRVDGGLEFRMPEAPSSDASVSVCIVVRADPDWVAGGTPFTYESATTGPPAPVACPPPAEG